MATYDLLNGVRSALGWEDRIPEVNRNSLHNLTTLSPTEMNDFINVLVKIVKQEIFSTTFQREDNPFADFFNEMLPAGYAVEDLYVDLITGAVPAWNDDGSVALSRKKPDITAIYHKQNYEMQYKVSTSYAQIKSAFMTVEGIDNLINRINSTLYNSCEYDIYLQCIELLSTAFHNGAIKPVYGASLASEAGIKALLKNIKHAAKEFTFMNNKYNGLGFSTRSRKEDVVIVMRSDVRDTIDVDVLAGVFNLSKAEIDSRIIEVPEDYGFGGYSTESNPIYCMVLDKRFMRIIPTLFEGGAITNPASLVTNTFLTTQWIFSYANFINAIAFVGGSAPTLTVTNDASSTTGLTLSGTKTVGQTLTETAGANGFECDELYYMTPEGNKVIIASDVDLAATETVTFPCPAFSTTIYAYTAS